MLIGVTGGIGSGKSTVSTILAELLEAPSLSADQLCRELLQPGRAGYRQFVERFGSAFLARPTGPIDRVRLRQALFADDLLRRQLEAILHPLVREVLREARGTCRPGRFVVAEVPLLFECGWQDDFDWIVCVDAPHQAAAERVTARDHVSAGEVQRIMAAQLPPEIKKKQADSHIDNSGDQAALAEQVAELADFLQSRQADVGKSSNER